MLIFLLAALLVGWIIFTFAFAWIGTEFPLAQKLEKSLWNQRIDRLQTPPYSYFMKAYEEKNYLKSALFVMLCNAPMHLVLYVLGYFKIGLVLVVVQCFLMGCLVGMGDDKTRVYGIVTAVFEVSSFILSGCFGLFGLWRFWWVSALLLVCNGLVEAIGTCIGATGVPGAEAVREKQYKQ